MKLRKVVSRLAPRRVLRAYRTYQRAQLCKAHRGDRVFCPICQASFDIFETYGLHNRPNARCYRCLSLERHRLMHLYLTERGFYQWDHRVKLLHFAPEKVFYRMFSNMKQIAYYPCDLNPDKYRHANGSRVRKADITAIPFADNTFDFIICNHVLEHIPNDRRAMDELYRVMAPGGHGYFQVPIDASRDLTYEDFSITDPAQRTLAFGQHDHVRWYGRDYSTRLAKSGFIVKEDDFVRRFSDQEIFRYGLEKDELIYFCTKS